MLELPGIDQSNRSKTVIDTESGDIYGNIVKKTTCSPK